MTEVVCGLIIHRGKLLITQHGPDGSHPWKWEFPGGKIQPGETALEALERELDEELDAEVIIVSHLTAADYKYPGKSIRLQPFLCRLLSETFRLNEHHACQWISPEMIYSFDLLEADKVMLATEGNFERLLHYAREESQNA